jgi:regulation of enolase protein 1 (concanavalin A-like superfamily)
MYQRAIGICEAHGLHDWIVYPRSRLAWVLAESGSGAEVARAQELMRVCLPVAETQQDVRLLVDLYCTQMWIATRQIDWEALKRAFRLSLAYGGITEIYLWLVLEAIEATCHRVGAHATFAELCREMMEEYTRVGREAPLQQWYLAPTAPRDPASLGARPDDPDVREEFEGEGWHPSLRWQDSMGGSRVDRTTRRGWLGISPAVGADLWPETNLNAPRLVARVRGDYVVQTRVDLGESVDTNVGLLLWQDEQDFVRLELHRVRTSKERAAVYLAACVEGRFRIIGRGQCERRPMWLRVERAGEEVRGLCSADGDHWLACGSVRVPQRTEEVVGLAAHSIYPGEHVWFDTLLLWERPVRIL